MLKQEWREGCHDDGVSCDNFALDSKAHRELGQKLKERGFAKAGGQHEEQIVPMI